MVMRGVAKRSPTRPIHLSAPRAHTPGQPAATLLPLPPPMGAALSRSDPGGGGFELSADRGGGGAERAKRAGDGAPAPSSSFSAGTLSWPVRPAPPRAPTISATAEGMGGLGEAGAGRSGNKVQESERAAAGGGREGMR